MARRLAAVLFVVWALAAPARADVTVTSATGGKGMGLAASGESVTRVKGLKMRSDLSIGGRTLSTIIDLDRAQFISLDEAARTAEISDMAQVAASLEKVRDGDVSV
jgi:hypothetical protein